MLKALFFFVTSFLSINSFYGQTRIGSWEDHLSLNNCISVCKLNGKIYACSYSSVFIYNETDKSIEKINKINGLSDVGIHVLKENTYNNRLMVIYENSNIDIIKSDNTVSNYSDIFNKQFSGKKNVNDALFVGKMAYLSCGFGIALFDTEKLEVKDTYIIGPNGTNLEVFQVAMDDSLMYAATSLGLLKCNYKTQILNNYQNWVLASPTLPTGYYSNVINFNNTILTTYSPFTQSAVANQDTVYQFNGINWFKFPYFPFPYSIKKIKQTNSYLSCINITQNILGTVFLDANYLTKAYISQYDTHNSYANDMYTDGKTFWIADPYFGLIKTAGSSPYFKPEYIRSNGIDLNYISNIDVYNGTVAISPMLINNAGGATFSKEGININNNGVWSYLRSENAPIDSVTDYCAVLLDRKDPSRMWASSWVEGLVEFKNNVAVNVYNGNNTGGAMEAVVPNWWRASGMDMDVNGNLFFAVSDVPHYLSVRKTNGAFQKFLFDGTARFVRKIHCDKNGQVWILHERDQGLTVCSVNETSSNFSIGAFKILDANVGTGNLESNSVYSIVEDLDGKIWVGTGAGIRVFSTPNTILTGGPVDGDPIKIVQDGNVELLLERETVTCMDVDAGNNKWVGTVASGVFCFSPDGQRQLFHFTAETSPLYSDEIIDIKYNGATGDIFIGSAIGLQSFKNVIKDGSTDYSTIFTYPNPVKPSYTGNVYVTGLVDNSVVKIADEAGNFVWETKSQGGRIEWPLKTFANNRVSSGVYTIYAATTTADLKAVSRVLVIN